MNLTTDDATKASKYLLTARVPLAASRQKTKALAKRIESIETNLSPGHPDYDGDVAKATQGLRAIVDDLKLLKKMRPAVAGFGEPLMPNLTLQLLPGVADAIEFIGKALAVLQPTQPE